LNRQFRGKPRPSGRKREWLYGSFERDTEKEETPGIGERKGGKWVGMVDLNPSGIQKKKDREKKKRRLQPGG